MDKVTSKDGTPIAYERAGNGPAVLLVGGGLDDGSENAALVPALADRFTVYNYARRGRGQSGDTRPYALEREFEDIAALIGDAGGAVYAFGASSGGALVLEAAAAGVPISRIAVHEVPYNMAADWPPRWRMYVEQVTAAVAEARPDDALAHFMRLTGTSEEELSHLLASPYWPSMRGLAHTLPYDAACLGDGRPPTERLARIDQPTLVMTGNSAQSGAAEWVLALGAAADAIAAGVQRGERATVEAGHAVEAEVLAPVLARFFSR
jgi:pimeloyl-ACP methyl ester carboxylesterase